MDEFTEVDFLVFCACVEGDLDGLPVHCFQCLRGPACLAEDVLSQWGAMHIPRDLGLEFLVVDRPVGDKIRPHHVGKNGGVRGALLPIPVRVHGLRPFVTVDVEECRLGERQGLSLLVFFWFFGRS